MIHAPTFKPAILARSIAALLVGSALLTPFTSPSAHAVSNSWNVNANGNWATAGSWLGSTNIPGSTTLDNADVATFSFTLTAARTVTVDTNRFIGGISFGNTSAFGYILSAGALRLNSGGVVQTLAANGAHTDTISSAIQISGTSAATAFFTAGATSATSLLSIGAVTGSATATNTTTLTLNGTNTGANAITGIIGNGAGGGNLAITKDGAGLWNLSGANTYSGNTTLMLGTLRGTVVGTSLTPTSTFGTSALLLNGGILELRASGTVNSTAQTITFGNNTTVGGNTTIDVDRPGSSTNKTLALGTLSIGANTLNVTNTAATGYALSFGATTLTGNAIFNPTTANLTLGAVGETGGPRSLTKNGAGVLTLSGASNYTGVTNVNAGSVTISNATALGTAAGNTVIASGAQVFTGVASTTYAEPFNIAGTGLSATGAIRTGGSFTGVIYSGAITLSADAKIQGDGSTGVTYSGGIDLGGNTLTLGVGGSATATVSTNGITGTGGSIIKDALTGTLNLNAANTYTGTTTLNAGTTSLGHVNALGGTTAITLGSASAATLTTQLDGITIAAPITLGNTGITSTIAFGRNTSAVGTLTLNGAIGGSGNLTFSTSGSSGGNIQTVFLGAASNYAGTTTITTANINNSTTIKLGVNNALPQTTVVSLTGGAGNGSGRSVNLDLNGFSQNLAGLTNTTGLDSRNQRVTNSSATPSVLTINNTADYTYGGQWTVTITTNAQITGNLALVKNGAGKFTLAAGVGNSFTGSTTVLGGILSLGHATSLQNSPLDTLNSVAGDATNGLQTTVTTLTLGGLTGNKNLADVFTTTSGGYSGLTALTLNPVTGATPSYSGVIVDGVAGMNLTKSGAGTQILTGANTYTGTTTISAGVLSAANIVVSAGSSNLGNATSAVTLGAAATQGTLSYTGNSDTYTRGLIIGGAGGGRLEVTTSGQTLTLSTADVTGSGLFTVGGAGNTSISANVTHTGGLTKADAGTLILSGANTYSGATTVNGGTLDVSGSLSGTTNVTVNTGGTLLLSGAAGEQLNDAATVGLGGGTLAFNNAANQIETLGALTLSVNSTLDFGLGGGNDSLLFAGVGAHTGGTTLTINNWVGNVAGGVNGTDDRLVFSGAFTDFTSAFNPSDVTFTGFGPGYMAIDFGGTSYEIVPVPEPSTVFAGLALLGLAGWRERRRQEQARRVARLA